MARWANILAAVFVLALTQTGVQPAAAQVPPDIAERLRQMGPVIKPQETSALYASRVREKEPYANVRIERDVAYGPAARNLLDTFVVPGATLKPVLVFVHGGGFVGGNKRLGPGSPYYDNVGVWAARNGMVGVTLTYRLAPQAQWPAGPEDLGRAVQWIHQNAARLGADPKRIFLFGHSVGAAHVAAYVAHPEFQRVPGSGLAGALLLSGIYEITPDLIAANPAYASYFGDDGSRYAEESALDGLIKTRVPLWIGNAELDPPTFRAQGELLRARLAQGGRLFISHDFKAHSHMSEGYSIYTDDTSVTDAILTFVAEGK